MNTDLDITHDRNYETHISFQTLTRGIILLHYCYSQRCELKSRVKLEWYFKYLTIHLTNSVHLTWTVILTCIKTVCPLVLDPFIPSTEDSVIVRCRYNTVGFPPRSSQKTHISPSRARYWVCFVILKSDSLSSTYRSAVCDIMINWTGW